MQDKTNDNRVSNIIELFKNISLGMFTVFIYLSVFFSLVISIYFLAVNYLIGLAYIGIIIFKFLIIFYLTSLFLVLASFIIKQKEINKLKFQERRKQIKEELKLEILNELNNGNTRRNKPGKKSN